MNRSISDTFEPLGIAVGGFLVLVALGTLVGTPWQTNNDAVVSAVQLVGVLLTAAVGVGLVWLARQSE